MTLPSGLREQTPAEIQKEREGKLFLEWWIRDGKFIDPDHGDVFWFDKRKGIAEAAHAIGMAHSRNYVADATSLPTVFHFQNGVTVSIQYEDDEPYLHIMKP